MAELPAGFAFDDETQSLPEGFAFDDAPTQAAPSETILSRIGNIVTAPSRIVGAGFEGAGEGLRTEVPLGGFSPENEKNLQNLALMVKPDSLGLNPATVITDALLNAGSVALDASGRVISAGTKGMAKAAGQLVRELGLSQGKGAEREVENLLNFALLKAGSTPKQLSGLSKGQLRTLDKASASSQLTRPKQVSAARTTQGKPNVSPAELTQEAAKIGMKPIKKTKQAIDEHFTGETRSGFIDAFGRFWVLPEGVGHGAMSAKFHDVPMVAISSSNFGERSIAIATRGKLTIKQKVVADNFERQLKRENIITERTNDPSFTLEQSLENLRRLEERRAFARRDLDDLE